MVNHLRRTSEAVILMLLVLSPWAFGCIHPFFRYCLTAGICLILLLWSLELLLAPTKGLLSRFQVPLVGLLAVVLLQLIPAKQLADTLSPTSKAWKSQLYPSQIELLSDGEEATVPSLTARNRLSLHPAETLRRCIWLVLMILVFTRVQDLANIDTLRRLCLTCLINGSILAYFSIIQHFTEDEVGKLFWTYQSMGVAFGPFINRNHFAFYINICFGLSLGLIGSRMMTRFTRFDIDSLVESLKDSFSLWMVSVLVFMLGAVILCSSRGGMISLAGSLLITAAFVASTGTFRQGWRWFVLAAAIFALASWVQVWLGFDFADSRYADHADSRTALWLPLLKLVRSFPLLGTGLGTLPFVEPWTRTSATQNSYLEYAHNEYLQLAIETGLVGLACAVVFLILLIAKISKRIRDSRHNSWLYIGLLFSLCSIGLHSFTEFGLAIPAIAFLSAVVMGHIAGVGRAKPSPSSTVPGRILHSLVAFAIVTFTVVAFRQAKQFDLGERHLLAAQRAQKEEDYKGELQHYRQAIVHTPFDVEFLLEIARLRFEHFETETLSNANDLKEAQQVLVSVRELSPMSGLSHYMTGRWRETFQRADEPLVYFQRAGLSKPMDPTLAYITGLAQLRGGRTDDAVEHFRRSLELSPDHLGDILTECSTLLSQEQLSQELLPAEDERLLTDAADWIDKNQKQTGVDRTDLIRRLRQLALKTPDMKRAGSAELNLLRSTLYQQLGDNEKAIDALKSAVRYAPRDMHIGMQLAKLLLQEGRNKEAQNKLEEIVRHESHTDEARQLLKKIFSEESSL